MIEIMSSKQTRKENADKGELRRQSSNDIKKKKKKNPLVEGADSRPDGMAARSHSLSTEGLGGRGREQGGAIEPGQDGGRSHWRSWMLWVFPSHCPSQKRQGGARIEQSWLMGGTQGTGDLWHHDRPSGSGSRSLS